MSFVHLSNFNLKSCSFSFSLLFALCSFDFLDTIFFSFLFSSNLIFTICFEPFLFLHLFVTFNNHLTLLFSNPCSFQCFYCTLLLDYFHSFFLCTFSNLFLRITSFSRLTGELSLEHFLNFLLLFDFDFCDLFLFHLYHCWRWNHSAESAILMSALHSRRFSIPASISFHIEDLFVIFCQNFKLFISRMDSLAKFNFGNFLRELGSGINKVLNIWEKNFTWKHSWHTEGLHRTRGHDGSAQPLSIHLLLFGVTHNLLNAALSCSTYTTGRAFLGQF